MTTILELVQRGLLVSSEEPGEPKYSRRDQRVAYDKLAWQRAVENFVITARRAGYKVQSVEGGMWRVNTAKMNQLLASDLELYLFLLDRQLIEVKRLPHERTVARVNENGIKEAG